MDAISRKRPTRSGNFAIVHDSFDAMSKEGNEVVDIRRLFTRFRPARGARGHTVWWSAVTVVLLTTAGSAQRPHPRADVKGRPADGLSVELQPPLGSQRRASLNVLPPTAEAKISSTVGRDEPAYHAMSNSSGFRMNNPNHQVSADF